MFTIEQAGEVLWVPVPLTHAIHCKISGTERAHFCAFP